jgi:Tol biopolymer transport system component
MENAGLAGGCLPILYTHAPQEVTVIGRLCPTLHRSIPFLLLVAAAGCEPSGDLADWHLTPLTGRPEDPDTTSIYDQNDLMASASPNGASVLFTSRRSGTFRLYVMNVDGSNVRVLTSGPGTQMQGSWSPDSRRIVYIHRDGESRRLVVINADGSDAKTLADDPGSWPVPAWMPDGRRILYHAAGPIGSDDIWSVDVETGERTLLLGSPRADRQAASSPDGGRIVFTSRRDGEDDEIYVAQVGGGSWTQLTDNDVNDYTPSWSPDGSRIVFQSNRGGRWTIFTIKPDGSDETPVTHYPAQYDPVWSYDGSEIFFNSDRDGRRGIYVMNADGLNERKLTNNEPSTFVRVVRDAGVDEATRLFREARVTNPQAVYFYEEEVRYLGENYLEMGHVRQAMTLFEVNVEAYPQSKAAHMDLGAARLAAGEVALAIESYQRALEIDADDGRIAPLIEQLRATAGASEETRSGT